MLNLIFAWKGKNWTTEVPDELYRGNDGAKALEIAREAHKSGKYAKVARSLVHEFIPVAPAGKVTPKAFLQAAVAATAEKAQKTTKQGQK